MRTPIVSRDQIPERFLEAFDAETANTGGQVSSGPGSAMMNSPEMRRRCNQISGFLRRESSLSVKLQELAMITTARAMDCRYIWNAHAAGARREGISDAVVDAIRDNQPLPNLPADEAIVVAYGMEFFKTHKISSDTFQKALDQFGAMGLTELSTLMGYYALLAFNANAFEIDLPEDRTEPVLPI